MNHHKTSPAPLGSAPSARAVALVLLALAMPAFAQEQSAQQDQPPVITLMVDAGVDLNLGSIKDGDSSTMSYGGLAANTALMFDLDKNTSIGPSLGWLTYGANASQTMFIVPLTCDLRFKGDVFQGVLGLGPGFFNMPDSVPVCVVAKAGFDLAFEVSKGVDLYFGPSFHFPMFMVIDGMSLGIITGLVLMHGQVHAGLSFTL